MDVVSSSTAGTLATGDVGWSLSMTRSSLGTSSAEGSPFDITAGFPFAITGESAFGITEGPGWVSLVRDGLG